MQELTTPSRTFSLNPQIDEIEPSLSIHLAERAKAIAASGRRICDLTIGEPDFDTPTIVKEAAVTAIRANNTHYVNGRGIPALRERIAQKLCDENQIPCKAQNILVTPGAKSAIYISVRTLLAPGDEAIVLDPSWVSYAPIVQAAGGVVRRVCLPYEDGHRITMHSLESALTSKSRLLIVNSPNNPTGRVLTEEEAQIIARFVSRNNLFVIADEIYEKIIFDCRPHISLGAMPEIADCVVTVNGLSKSVAMTGWRIGYLHGNRELVDKVYMLYQHMLTCISGFAQEAAIAAFDCHSEIEMMRLAFETRRNSFVSLLNQIPGIACRRPEGAFYAWARVGGHNMGSIAFCEFLLERAGVAAVPGIAYGTECEECVRFSLACSDAILDEAADRIATALAGPYWNGDQ